MHVLNYQGVELNGGASEGLRGFKDYGSRVFWGLWDRKVWVLAHAGWRCARKQHISLPRSWGTRTPGARGALEPPSPSVQELSPFSASLRVWHCVSAMACSGSWSPNRQRLRLPAAGEGVMVLNPKPSEALYP